MDKTAFRNSIMGKLGLGQEEEKDKPSSFRSSVMSKLNLGQTEQITPVKAMPYNLSVTQPITPKITGMKTTTPWQTDYSPLKSIKTVGKVAGAIIRSPMEFKAGREKFIEATPAAVSAGQRSASILTEKIGETSAKVAEGLNLPGQLVEYITKGKYQAPKLDPIVFDSISKTLEEKSEENLELSQVLQQSGIQIQDTRAFSEKIQDPKFIAEGLGGNLPNLLMSLGVAGAGTVAGGPVVGAVAGFGSGAFLEGGYAYNEAKSFLENSEDPNQRALAKDKDYLEKIAVQVGLVNGLLEVMPITKLLNRNPLGDQIKKRILTKIMNRVVTQAGIEGGTESLQEIVSNVVAQEYDVEREVFQGVEEAGFFGALMGGGISTVADLPTITKDIKPGLTIEDVSKGAVSQTADLVTEAKKYSTQEKFVSEGVENIGYNKAFHGSKQKELIGKYDITKASENTKKMSTLGEGIYFADNSTLAQRYGNVNEIYILPNTKILNIDWYSNDAYLFREVFKNLPEKYQQPKSKIGAFEIMELANKNPEIFKNKIIELGYDGVKINYPQTGSEFVVYDVNKIVTKSQLTDIWKKAQPEASPKPSPLIQEAKKYKSAEEFVKSKNPKIELEIFEDAKEITLQKILVKPNERSAGIGTKAMEDLIGYADKNNKRILLTPSKDYGASSVSRLTKFYKNFGFVENKGGKRDFSTRESMIRKPKPSLDKTKSQLKDIWKKAQPEAKLPTAVKGKEGIKTLPKKKVAEKAVKTTVILKAEEKQVKISEDIYKANRETKRGIRQIITKDIKDSVANITLGTDKFLGAISTRLKNIHPELKRKLRLFEYNIKQKTRKDTQEVKPFLEATKKMSKEDYLDFDLARKNGDKKKIKDLIIKYKIGKEYTVLRKTLDDLYARADEVGYTIGYKESYHPRIIKDKVGFLNYFKKGNDWNIISQAISAKENALGRYLNMEEKSQLINTMIRGYQQNNITLSEIGNMKSRVIDIVDAELNQFYMDSNSALLSYITKANEAIEARKWFGKGQTPEGVDINDSIGGYVLKLMQEGKINPEQEVILSDILKDRFNEQGTRGIISTYKNLSYVDTMGSPISAITQIGDLSWSLYKGGFYRTARGVIRSATGKVAIKKEDIGIERIAEEFSDTTKSAKAVSTVFKLVGLEKIDTIGKETLIDSVISKYQSWAKSGNKRLTEKLTPVFGNDKKVLQEVVDDLKSGDITENIKLLAFNELADMQPIILSEMPQKYLSGGNGRLFYMLKTFTLKQFDIYRNEVFQKISVKSTRVEGMKNLISLLAFFVLMNATADEIKDFILNRKTNLKDRTVDNILRAVGFSKYLTWKIREEGLGSGLVRQILPPFKFIDSVSKDILKGIENGSEVTQSIPLGGKLYYWWFGKGQYKTKKRQTKKKTDYDLDLDLSLDLNLDLNLDLDL